MDAETGSSLQIAEHRVREAERHVAHFRDFVAKLHSDGMFADQAEDLLRQLETALEEHREYLAQVRADSASANGSNGNS